MNKTLNKPIDEIPITERSELFIGLVGATGADLNTVYDDIKKILKEFNYNVYQIKISKFFYDSYFTNKYNIEINKNNNVFQRVYDQMEAGNKIRKVSGYSSILAMYAIQEVQKIREETYSDNSKSKKGIAYVFQSLKHPEESKLLNEIYGPGYYQIGVYSEEEKRINYLKSKKNINESNARKLVEKDTDENKPYGQKTRDTFQLSDFFIKQNQNTKDSSQKDIGRIFDLIFGHPYKTPTIDEHMMYMAYTYSTRSSDLSRQVGTVICNEAKDIIGLGSNDVPCFGGGPYWPDDKEDWRDYRYIQDEWKNNDLLENRGKRGEDTNQVNRDQIIEKIIKVFQDETNWSFSEDKTSEIKLKLLKEAGINDIKEFGRPTHAEMSAILNCTRNGISPQGGTIYCTTFPCHNCARHIIDAGIKRVVFVEPYPSSKAKLLHCDSILVESKSAENDKKVTFEHFIGTSARRYLDLFSLKLGMGLPIERKDRQGKTIDFHRETAKPRVPLTVLPYLDKEKLVYQNPIL